MNVFFVCFFALENMYVEQRERKCRMNFNTTEVEVLEVNAHSVLQRERPKKTERWVK